jgi:hypothetical protein
VHGTFINEYAVIYRYMCRDAKTDSDYRDAWLHVIDFVGTATLQFFSGIAEEWWLVINHCFPSHIYVYV